MPYRILMKSLKRKALFFADVEVNGSKVSQVLPRVSTTIEYFKRRWYKTLKILEDIKFL